MPEADGRVWRLSPTRLLPLDRPRVMGVLNVTPDSFSDGGQHASPEDAVRAGLDLIRQGADLLDIGGESTRPGAASVPPAEQIERVVPVIRGLRVAGVTLPITIDTTRAEVAAAALDAGADAINDVSAGLDDAEVFRLAAHRSAGLVLMHRLAPPARDSYSTAYARRPDYPEAEGGVVGAVAAFLEDRIDAARNAGVAREAIAIDPGLGFGKDVEQNLLLMASVGELLRLNCCIVAGASRKSFIGAITGEPDPRDRVAGSVTAAVMLAMGGADVIRAHDVRDHVAALRVADRVRSARAVTRDADAASRL